MSEAGPVADAKPAEDPLRAVVRGLAWAMRDPDDPEGAPPFDRGTKAALRRLDLDRLAAPAFWKVLARDVEEKGWRLPNPSKNENERMIQERRWALLLKGMAMMAPHSPGGPPFGKAAGKSDLHEMRMERLLRSRGAIFEQALVSVLRFLCSKGEDGRFSWYSLAPLIIENQTDDEIEAQRRRIAHDFYAEKARKAKADAA